MNNNAKEILNYCPNFNRIMNFDYVKDDVITAKLIHIYNDYIFKVNMNSTEEVNEVIHFDYVLGRYIDDYEFRRELRKEIVQVKIKKTCADILRAIVESIIKIFDNYLENSTRRITIAHWI